MPVFMCRWQNGDFSIVKAANKNHAIELLDEFGNAEGCPVMAIKDFLVNFRLTDDGEFALEGFGECTLDPIWSGYPVLGAVQDAPTDKAGKWTEEGREIIRRAVLTERERVVPRKAKASKTLLGAEISASMDMPATMVDHIIEEEAEKTLEEFEGDGEPK